MTRHTFEPAPKSGPVPIKLTKDELRQVEEMASIGLTQDEIALILGFSEATLRRRFTDQGDVRTAWERGRANRKRDNLTRLRNMIEADHFGALVFWLKTSGGMAAVGDLDITLNPNTNPSPDGSGAQMEEPSASASEMGSDER
jgi:AraC-like DNA-binding protein